LLGFFWVSFDDCESRWFAQRQVPMVCTAPGSDGLHSAKPIILSCYFPISPCGQPTCQMVCTAPMMVCTLLSDGLHSASDGLHIAKDGLHFAPAWFAHCFFDFQAID